MAHVGLELWFFALWLRRWGILLRPCNCHALWHKQLTNKSAKCDNRIATPKVQFTFWGWHCLRARERERERDIEWERGRARGPPLVSRVRHKCVTRYQSWLDVISASLQTLTRNIKINKLPQVARAEQKMRTCRIVQQWAWRAREREGGRGGEGEQKENLCDHNDV